MLFFHISIYVLYIAIASYILYVQICAYTQVLESYEESRPTLSYTNDEVVSPVITIIYKTTS